MIKSMTGFGWTSETYNGKKFIVEVRTLNSRTLDANIRLPANYRELEAEIRILLGNILERGKVDLYMTIENETDFSEYRVNRSLAIHYLDELKLLAKESGLQVSSEILPAILRLPDVVSQSVSDIDDKDKNMTLELIRHALTEADRFRKNEGDIIEKDFEQRINLILDLLNETELFENKRVEDIRRRLNADLAQLENRVTIDSNRFEQEIIYYLERIDFNEEKFRLKKHCLDFLNTLADDISQGRKLGFISQEIGREINTLGAKAYNADIQKIVVEMKNELEKIKEQLLNIL